MVCQHRDLVLRLGTIMRDSGSTGEVESLMKDIDEVEGLLEKLEAPKAFQKEGPERQLQYLVASEYQDEYISLYEGRMYFRAWYMCSCGACISSKSWRQLHPEFEGGSTLGTWKAGQRWYCVCCSKRYRPRMGMLTELKMNDQVFWSLASVPPRDLLDIQGLALEADLRAQAAARGSEAILSPEDLHRSIVQCRPIVGSILRAATPADFWDPSQGGAALAASRVAVMTPAGRQLLEGSPMFPWLQMFNWA